MDDTICETTQNDGHKQESTDEVGVESLFENAVHSINAVHCVSQSKYECLTSNFSVLADTLPTIPYDAYVLDKNGYDITVYKVIDRCIVPDIVYRELERFGNLIEGSLLPEVSTKPSSSSSSAAAAVLTNSNLYAFSQPLHTQQDSIIPPQISALDLSNVIHQQKQHPVIDNCGNSEYVTLNITEMNDLFGNKIGVKQQPKKKKTKARKPCGNDQSNCLGKISDDVNGDRKDCDERSSKVLQKFLALRIVGDYAYAKSDFTRDRSLGIALMLAIQRHRLKTKQSLSAFNRSKYNRKRLVRNYSDFCASLGCNTTFSGTRILQIFAKKNNDHCISVVNRNLEVTNVVVHSNSKNIVKEHYFIAEGPNKRFYPTNKRGFVRLGVRARVRIRS
jgi:hypothetical protein